MDNIPSKQDFLDKNKVRLKYSLIGKPVIYTNNNTQKKYKEKNALKYRLIFFLVNLLIPLFFFGVSAIFDFKLLVRILSVLFAAAIFNATDSYYCNRYWRTEFIEIESEKDAEDTKIHLYEFVIENIVILSYAALIGMAIGVIKFW